MPKICAYCGSPGTEREHVVPRCLYPASKARSPVQRVTVPACRRCNSGWADAEAHFRNVMVIAGEPNTVVHEIWSTSVRRSFEQIDGRRRLDDIVDRMEPAQIGDVERWKVYPGQDSRVLGVLRKIVRGLSHFHQVETAVGDDRVWVDVMKYRIPDYLLAETAFLHREQDVFEYWYEGYDEGGLSSVWLLRVFEKREFVASVVRA